jgi:dTDP-4-amino-4,6-dideoxygalactose transaminase
MNLHRPWAKQSTLFVEAAVIAGTPHLSATDQLTDDLAERFGVKREQVVLTCSGTVALGLLWNFASTASTWTVRVPAYGFVATANGVGLAPGNRDVRLVDVDPATGWMLGTKYRFQCPVAFSGTLESFLGYRVDPSLEVILDGAAILGNERAKNFFRISSSLKGVALSFSATKLISAGMGGAAIFADADTAREAMWFIHQGGDWAAPDGPGQTHPGTNLRMGYWQAALALAHLRQIDDLRAACADAREVFEAAYGDRLVPSAPGAYNIVRTERARSLHGVAGARWRLHRALYNHAFWNDLGDDATFPGAAEAERTYLYLPYGPGVTREDAERIVEQLGDLA